MKQLFFTVATIAIPGAIFSWILWLFVKGVYTVVSDWTLGRELKQIRAESAMRSSGGAPDEKGPSTPVDPAVELKAEPVISFALDEPPSTAEEQGTPRASQNAGNQPPAV